MGKKLASGEPIGISRIAAVDSIVSLGEWFIKQWPILTALFGGSTMSYLASLNPRFKAWQWGAIGIATGLLIYLVVVLVYAAWAWAVSKRAQARYSQEVLDTASINPLDPIFERKRIPA